MKHLSFITLTALLTLASCSHHHKRHCCSKEAVKCEKENCEKKCCDKKHNCKDGSCTKDKAKDAKADCKDGSCHKKTK